MKLNTPFSYLFVLILFSLYLLCPSCEWGEETSCTLPAPTAVSANIIDTNTVQLVWTAVDSAKGYRIIVETQSDSIFTPIDTLINSGGNDTTRVVENLTGGLNYRARVSAFCSDEDDPASINENFTVFSLIIGDVVVMMPSGTNSEPGLNDCNCTNPSTWSTVTPAPAGVDILAVFDVDAQNRAVFEFEFTHGDSVAIIKLAFNRDCITVKGRKCSDEGVVRELAFEPDGNGGVGPIRIELDDEFSRTSFLEIRSMSIGGNSRRLNVEFDNICTTCGLRYRECVNTSPSGWGGPCG